MRWSPTRRRKTVAMKGRREVLSQWRLFRGGAPSGKRCLSAALGLSEAAAVFRDLAGDQGSCAAEVLFQHGVGQFGEIFGMIGKRNGCDGWQVAFSAASLPISTWMQHLPLSSMRTMLSGFRSPSGAGCSRLACASSTRAATWAMSFFCIIRGSPRITVWARSEFGALGRGIARSHLQGAAPREAVARHVSHTRVRRRLSGLRS